MAGAHCAKLWSGFPQGMQRTPPFPAVELQVLRGRLELGRALLRLDEGFEFEGLTLRFPEIRYWGEFSIVRDPGTPVLFLAYAVGLAGLLLKLPIRGGGG